MAEELWTVQRLLVWTTGFFTKKGIEAPRRTAEILLSHVLGEDRVHLYMDFERPLNQEERGRFRELVQRRAAREPTDYLTGHRGFFGLDFAVDPRVLVPRPETEQLVELALSRLPPGQKAAAGSDESAPSDQEGLSQESACETEMREAGNSGADEVHHVLDLCSGSGCVGIAIAANRPNAAVVASDISRDALAVAEINAEKNGVRDRISFRCGDLFETLRSGELFDVIVSNPPYVRRGIIPTLSPEVRREPVIALDGGADGLDLIRSIASGAGNFLRPGGTLCMEIGDEQGEMVRQILIEAGFSEVLIEKDFAGLDRIASGRKAMK